MPFLFERLGDTSALRTHGCLTVAQCALLIPAMLASSLPGDATEVAAHYIQLALLDIAHGELSPKHPQTHLPYSQYLRMTEAGMYGLAGENLPLPTADWLVTLDEAERWLRSKDIHFSFDGIRADLEKMRNEGMEDWPEYAVPVAAETAPASAASEAEPALESGRDWILKAQERVRDPLAIMIYDVLKTAHSAGEQRPKARDVMNAIAAKKPADFVELIGDEIKVVDARGNHDAVTMERVRARINRMTGP